MFATLQKLGRSLMLPIAVMPAAPRVAAERDVLLTVELDRGAGA